MRQRTPVQWTCSTVANLPVAREVPRYGVPRNHSREVPLTSTGPVTPEPLNRQRLLLIRGSGTTNTLAPPIRPQDRSPCDDSHQVFQSPSSRDVLAIRSAGKSAFAGKHRERRRSTRAGRSPQPAPPSESRPPWRTDHPRPPQSQSSPTFFIPPTPAIPTTYHPRPLSPPPPSACPPDTMWLREGFARANLPRGKRIPDIMSGSPSVNSSVFNKASRNSGTLMSGMGSLWKKLRKPPPIGSTWAPGSAASRPSPSSPINAPPLRRCP